LRGQSPNILAGLVEVISTNLCASIFPARTPPSQSSISRVSMPGAPLGIFEKSSLPICFCGGSFMQKGQWSVETTEEPSGPSVRFWRLSLFMMKARACWST
jgi:hypothetical protein